FRINPLSGAATFVATITGLAGPLGSPVMSLMSDPLTGVMYASLYANPTFLFTVNTTTGIATPVGSGLAPFVRVVGGDFQPLTANRGARVRAPMGAPAATAVNFGNIQDLGTVTGTKFNDLDGDGVRDPGEPGLQGWTIYVDLNNNGTLDGGEPSTT